MRDIHRFIHKENIIPYPHEHSARVAEPLVSNSATFARKQISPGISIVLQKNKGDTAAPMKTQSYRFSKSNYTPDAAKAWLKSHNIKYISFEPASEPEAKEDRKSIIDRITKELSNSVI